MTDPEFQILMDVVAGLALAASVFFYCLGLAAGRRAYDRGYDAGHRSGWVSGRDYERCVAAEARPGIRERMAAESEGGREWGRWG